MELLWSLSKQGAFVHSVPSSYLWSLQIFSWSLLLPPLVQILAVVQVQEQYSVSVAWQQLIELHSLVMTWEAPEFSLFCVCLGFASTMLMERGPEHIFDGQGNLKSPTVLTQHLRSTEYFCLVSTAT